MYKTGFTKSGLLFSFFFALLSVFCTTYAQESTVFSGEISKYPDELTSFIQKNINPVSEKTLNDFITAWKQDSLFTADEQDRIVRFSILYELKGAKPYPHFTHYLRCLLLLKKDAKGPANYNSWEKGFNVLLNDRKRSLAVVERYVSFTQQLIDSSSLYSSGSVNWKINTNNYSFASDTAVQLIIHKTDLTCFAKHDSIRILGTSGIYYPVTSVWKGTEGLVTWESAGFSRSDVYAQLETYEINLSRSEYRANDVTFSNKFYFDKPLKGILTDKVKLNRTPEDADYPQFDSYQKDFKIDNLYENINYEGGLSMQGAKLVGTGNREKEARIFIYRKDTLVLVASSYYFAFKTNRINAPKTSVIINLMTDSIFHPGIALSYISSTRELTLYRTDDFTSQSPYFDSYHNLDMTFDQLVWKMNEPVMRFTSLMGSTIGNANFESVSFFNNDQYLRMQLLDEVHPLVSVRSFSRYMGTDEFLANDFAGYLKKPVAQVKQLLMRLASQGFLYYDNETGMATIRPRLNDYLAASVARIDYDVISIPSNTVVPVENAVFDLRNYNLTINGIPRIFVSDSQNVVIYPANDRIIMKKNRNFQFDGQVQAGLFTFNGKNFFFNYENFKIDLQKIDSLRIRYLTGAIDGYGFPVVENAQNLIQDLNGELYIDKPDNKSGRMSYAEYPIFRSKENGFVYYDDKAIYNGIYDRKKFFFKIDPFEMDSLDNFDRQSMEFSGEFNSAGIFPVFQETLRLQVDKSLGFKHYTADSGLHVYGEKGSFTNEITLSNKGLQGAGTLTYLTSNTGSGFIQFFPDSLLAVADDFTINQKTTDNQFPYVKSVHNRIRWLPYQDELHAYRTDSLFHMFNSTTVLAGNLILRPSDLSGEGRMIFEGAELQSDHYSYKANEIDADSADFYLKSLHSDGFTVLTENMDAHIDFAIQKGTFESNEDFTLVSFPENKYVSYLDHFEWDMEKKELAMGSRSFATSGSEIAEEGAVGPKYICIDPAQDSLSFVSPLAFYDYDSNYINATQVKYIDIADARIYPYNETLTVQPNAWLKALYKAKIKTNRTTGYFNLYDATLNITARNKYTGSAYYNYTDELGQQQPVFFNSVGVDNNLQTIGTGNIAESDDFTLGPNYRYQGRVFLEASEKLLTFEGGVLIEHNCDVLSPRWLYFNSEIDPQNIFIPVNDDLVDINRNKIFNGLFMYYDSVHIYPAFLSGRKNYSDKALVSSGGYLYFDKALQQYVIASKDKLLDRNAQGNLISLHRENCELYGEGKLDLGAKLGQTKLITVGNISYNTINKEVEADVVLGMDFYIADNIINIMASEVDSIPNLSAVDLNRNVYTKGIVELIGKSRFDALRTDISLFGSTDEVPDELKHTLLFNELKLRWNNESNSWVSTGKIGIASINNTQINKRVDGLIELQIKRSGDILDVYLQLDRRSWYYFGYTRGLMQVHSSNQRFLDRIIKLKPNERRLKVSGGESYIYMVSTDAKKNTFVRKFRDISEGNSE
jgi:hypothetical protein